MEGNVWISECVYVKEAWIHQQTKAPLACECFLFVGETKPKARN